MTNITIDSDKLLIAKAKKQAAKWMPFLQSVFGPMRCTATSKCKTAAVDQYGRMYYNPEFFSKLSVEVVAYVILHETLHCVLSHCKRTRRMIPDLNKHKALLANIAQDLCIQQALAKEIPQFEPKGIVRLPEWTHIPGITAGRTSEQYYEALLAYKPEPSGNPGPAESDEDKEEDESDDPMDDSLDDEFAQESDDETTDDAEDGDSEGGESDGESDDESSGSAGQGESDEDSESDEGEGQGGGQGTGQSDAESDSGGDPAPFPDLGDLLNPEDAGSNSDGVEKEWEEEPSLADISSMEHRLRETETVLDQMNPRRGTGAGDIHEAIKARLRPMPDPFDQLKHVVSKSISSPVGSPSLTYRKWPRRSLPGDARLRGVERLQPEATILLDTSGSMLDCGVKERALAIVAKGISRLQNPRIVCCDGAVQSARRVANMQHFQWDGGGGTDMAGGLVYVDNKYHPDTIVIITDGITYWPAQPTKAKVVCALCCADWANRIPKWIKVVHLYREPRRYVL